MTHAPVPTNDSERLLFRDLYDTLVRLDCQGHPRPGLAVGWSANSTGRVWTFALSGTARLPGGPAIHPADVVSAWQARREAGESLGVQSAVVVDQTKLAVTLMEPVDSVPRFLADPALAVPVAHSDSLPVLDFQMVPNGDPRDALDRGAGLVVTRDPAVVEYAGSRPELTTFALPWSRTYVLLQSAGAAESLPSSLARDAVRAEARPAEPPFWWDGVVCPSAHLPDVAPPAQPRVVYSQGDEVARALSERIVGLAGSGTQLRAAALGQTEFAAALRNGSERAYIVAVPRQSLAPCRDAAAWPAGATVKPLIDTRATAILRRGSPALTVEWDGAVRVLGEGRRSQRKP